ncbi:unnamed protein product [Arctogadus glacialis]
MMQEMRFIRCITMIQLEMLLNVIFVSARDAGLVEQDSLQQDSLQQDSLQQDSPQDSLQQDSLQQDSLQQDSLQQDSTAGLTTAEQTLPVGCGKPSTTLGDEVHKMHHDDPVGNATECHLCFRG